MPHQRRRGQVWVLNKIPAGFPKDGRPGLYASCVILMHSSLAATRESRKSAHRCIILLRCGKNLVLSRARPNRGVSDPIVV